MSAQPLWLDHSDVRAIHRKVIDEYGGASGIRDEGLLNSAIAAPYNSFGYGETDHFKLAATYVRGIVLNHPFVDGNKRTEFVAGLVFLEINGVWVSADPQQAAEKVIGMINRKETVDSLAAWLADNSK